MFYMRFSQRCAAPVWHLAQFSLFMCGFHLSEQAEERKQLEWMTSQLLELEPSELRVDIIFS